jgi:hypothetical protein
LTEREATEVAVKNVTRITNLFIFIPKGKKQLPVCCLSHRPHHNAGMFGFRFTAQWSDLMFQRNILPIAGLCFGVLITVAWAAFLGFTVFQAVGSLL